MNRARRLFRSSIGAKLGMALTGLLLALFLVAHLSGNLLVYGGRDAVNAYAEGLRELGPLLWLARAGLLAVFVVHVWLGIRIARRNRAARPVHYAYEDTVQATWASRTMIWTGLLVLAFLLLHLAHFTFGWTDPESFALEQRMGQGPDDPLRHDVYNMVVQSFHSDLYVVAYVLSMIVLGFHTSHGLHSMFQTLGFRHVAYTPAIERIARALAWLLVLGYVSIPVVIRVGLVGPEGLS